MVNVRDVLLLQKREVEEKKKELYIKRYAVLKEKDKDIIKAVIGPRRAGKSSFVIHELSGSGSWGYINFDDENLVDLEDYNELIENMKSVYGNPKILFLDEIQNLKKWELFVNRLQRQGFNIIVSGSNANLLSQELATHLTGRHLTTNVFPLSFKEFLSFFGKREDMTEAEIKERFRQYAEEGGYPEPLVKNMNRKDYLSTLFDAVIYKDIVKRYRIRAPAAFEDLAVYAISNATNSYSYNTLAEVTKVRSASTVEKYLKYLEESFLLFRTNRFSFKLKRQMKSEKKIYCIDNGLITARGFRVSDSTGSLYENIAAVHLWKKFGENLFYYKSRQGGYEVDFVVRRNQSVEQLIQASFNLDKPETKLREFRALAAASKELDCDNLIALTGDRESEEWFEWFGVKRKIKCVPLWKWLLD